MFGGVTPPTLAKREIRELVAGRGLAPALRLGPVSLRPVAGELVRLPPHPPLAEGGAGRAVDAQVRQDVERRLLVPLHELLVDDRVRADANTVEVLVPLDLVAHQLLGEMIDRVEAVAELVAGQVVAVVASPRPGLDRLPQR